jgi:hypothetical protein
MHPGVGAAGPVDRLANPIAEAGQGRLEFPLDRPDSGPLSLEAGKVRAIVFNRGAEAPRRALSDAAIGDLIQTSSICTIGAASPRRGPIFTIRV